VGKELTVTGNVTVSKDLTVTEELTVTGNVGIGTDSPENSLHIYKNANERTSGLFIEKAEGGTNAAALFFGVNNVTENPGVAKAAIFYERNLVNGRGDIKFCNDEVNDANAVTTEAADTRMIIKNDGKVGIGTNSPQQNLHVHEVGSGQVVIAVTNDTTGGGNNDGIHFGLDASENGFIWHKQSTALKFATNNIEQMSISSQGYFKYNNQPRFSAYSNSGDANYGAFSGGPVKLTSTFYNVGSHYSTSTGAFTAPVTGHYRFSITPFNNASSRQVSMWYRTSNSGTWDDIGPYKLLGGSPNGDETIFSTSGSQGNSWTIDLYVPVNYQIGFGGRGGVSITIYRAHSYFSGELISAA
jgi:hypothetical protein